MALGNQGDRPSPGPRRPTSPAELPRYTFRVMDGYEEVPVSIADLGGTEIDMRMQGDAGGLSVVVAPVMRFADIPFNADVRIEMLGSPDKLIRGFAPELIGQPLEDRQILSASTAEEEDGLTYYRFELSTPAVAHSLVTMTALGNRVFILTTNSNSREFRKGGRDKLRKVQESFRASAARVPGLQV